MQTFKGIQTLIAAVGSLPDCGFLYITGNSDYNSWLEAPTFSDIIENYTSKHPNASEADLICAVLHYWEKDDFLD